jgi:ribose transport system substrate-binding protein
MRNRLQFLLVLLTLGAMVLSACQPAAAPTAAPEEPAGGEAAEEGYLYHFCVVHNNADHPSITATAQGFEDEAAVYNIEVTFFDPAFDPQKQISQIEDCIALDADVIFVNAVDPAAVVAGLKKVDEAGIPLIMHNADTNEEGQQYSLSFVGSDYTEQGRAVGRTMVAQLPDGSKGVILSGKPGQTGVQERIDGAQEVIDASGKDIQFVDVQPAEWMMDKAMTVMQDFLTRYPSGEINFVYGLDDPMALGALEAIKAAGREDEFMVFGVNGNKEACEAIKAGDMNGTALQLSYLAGVYSVRAGYDVLQGRLIPSRIDAPTAGVTPENVDQWFDKCW